MYKVEWIKFPNDLEADRLQHLMNSMAASGYEFVNLYHFEEVRQIAVVFKATQIEQMRNATLRF